MFLTWLLYELTFAVLFCLYTHAMHNQVAAGQYMLTAADINTLYAWTVGTTAAVAGILMII